MWFGFGVDPIGGRVFVIAGASDFRSGLGDAFTARYESLTPSPTLSPTRSPTTATAWEKTEAKLCFNIHTQKARDAHCGDIMLAVYLAVVFAFLSFFVVEFVMIPIHAVRDSCIHRIPYCQALRHAWLHQCWCFARVQCFGFRLCRGCARRAEPVLADEDGNAVSYFDWRAARAAHDRLMLADGDITVNANPLNAPFLRDASFSDLEAEMFARRIGGLMRDASPSDLDAMLAVAQERREGRTAPAGMRITNVMEGEQELLSEEEEPVVEKGEELLDASEEDELLGVD